MFEAWDEELAIPVALKALFDLGSDQEGLWRLKREVLLARSVAHPHVCRVYDLGRHGDGPGAVWFLTMELLGGETLKQRLQRVGRLEPEAALPLVEQVASGLAAAHAAGVVHRDLKSANVMIAGRAEAVGAEERAVVTDFGLARAVDGLHRGEIVGRLEAAGAIAGTPAYMSPEQVRGEVAGPGADIYALGVVLYEIVTGMLPFTGETPMEIARRRLSVAPPSPRVAAPDLDERWEEVILRCLELDPGSRFESAGEVATALRGEGGHAAPGALPGRRHALPAEADAFVGRDGEIEALELRFGGESRFITLLGTAGVGKTRLAVRYGWQSRGRWPGGVWFCDLTEARTPGDVASTVARTLGLPLSRGDAVAQVGNALLGRGRCLVILDNFEQLVERAADTVGGWRDRAREVRWLVTSRERLGIRGEEATEVLPLSLEPAVQLFVERARRQQPALELGASELAEVREVVRLTEGIPLAVELAAARRRLMTTADLRVRMQEQLFVLGGAKGRHGSLESAIDASWVLLAPWEKAAFAQCSVFEGGFTLEAAERILDLRRWPEVSWTLDVIQSLVDKSLLRSWMPAKPAPGGPLPEVRFGMYVSVREYARRRLGQDGAVPKGGSGPAAKRAAEERHGAWYARYGVDEALDAVWRGGVHGWAALGLELDNLMAACRRAVRRGAAAMAAGAYEAAWRVHVLRGGPFQAVTELGRDVLAMDQEASARAAVLRALGNASNRSGRSEEGQALTEEALAIARTIGHRRMEGNILGDLGSLHREQGRMDEARASYEAAIGIHREVGNHRDEGIAIGNLGILHLEQGRMEEARASYEAALAIHRRVGNRTNEGIVLGNLANLHLDQGRIGEARLAYEEALAVHRQVGDRRAEGVVLGNLAELHAMTLSEEALRCYAAALNIHREVGNRRSEGVVLGNLGDLYRELGRRHEARVHLEQALAIHREVGNRRFEGVVLGALGNLAFDEGRLDNARVHYEAALAVHRAGEDRRFEGIVLGELGQLLMEQEKPEEAGDALHRAESLLREVGDPLRLADVLCVWVELDRRGGALDSARKRLAEAERLASKAKADSASRLASEVARLRGLLNNIGPTGPGRA